MRTSSELLLKTEEMAEKTTNFQSELMTTQEVANFFKVARWTVWDWRKRGILKGYGVGRKVFFKREEVKNVLVELLPSSKA